MPDPDAGPSRPVPDAPRTPERAARRAGEEHFRLLVESVTDYAIFVLDPGGHIASWNRGAERIKGWREDDILGQHFSRFYTPEDQARNHPANELKLAVQNGTYSEEGWRVRQDGSRFWASVVITSLMDERGELRGFAKVTRDMTERREHERALAAKAEALERANADLAAQRAELAARNLEQEAFVYTVSHDLRAPLLAIHGMAELLLDAVRRGDADDAEFLVARVARNTEKMGQLLTDLLALSRVGRSGEQVEAVDLGDVARTALADLAGRLEPRGVAVVSPAAWPRVLCAPSEAYQLLANLVGNAIRWAGRPGESPRVQVHWRFHGPLVELRVDDNGPGVPAQYRERVFELFRKLDAKAEGTGVGLAIVRRIAERHGGKAWVEDSKLGGASFAVTLPLAT